MTKDGRPSLINDIRYFCGRTRHSPYLKGHEDAVAFGRRLAWYLNGQGISIGAYTSLYLLLTPALKPGAIEITDEGGDWWQRYTYIGVPEGFPDGPDSSAIAIRGTVDALKAIRPDICDLVDNAASVITVHGSNFRFLLRTKTTRRFVVEVSCTIAEWPAPSHLYVSLSDRNDGSYRECRPTPLKFYFDAFDLAGTVQVTDRDVRIVPGSSFSAKLIALKYDAPIGGPVSEFFAVQRPTYSGIVKRRG